MAYGTREGNYFQAKQNNNQGVPTTTNFSVTVEDNTQGTNSGLITIYAENGKRVVGTIPRGGSFIPNPNATDPSNELKAEFNYFSQQSNITVVKDQAIITVQRSLSKTADPNQTPAQRQAIARSVVFGPQQGANPDGSVVSPTLTPGPGSGAAPVSVPLPNPENIPVPTINAYRQRKSYDHYFYPTNIKKNNQDFIQFIAYEYVGRGLNVGQSTNNSFDAKLGFDPRNFGSPLGSVTLPIQPSITDTNAAQWGGEDINSLQAYAASVSYAAQSDIAGTGERVIKDLDTIFKSGNNSNISNAVRLFLAGKAVGVSGLLSRMGGAVINPNLELLFQGPQLRPFNFTFRLSPRDENEAEQVKYIIRYFKQNMSVKNTEFNLFMKAPNVFKIKYHLRGTDKDHPSLNKIKMCALQSCSVDYTPDGSYMTFNDESATMTSYNLSLQFQELEPVTEKDYQDLKDETIIGY
jgi:hypothetical protein